VDNDVVSSATIRVDCSGRASSFDDEHDDEHDDTDEMFESNETPESAVFDHE
jgi:hypothetical protein